MKQVEFGCMVLINRPIDDDEPFLSTSNMDITQQTSLPHECDLDRLDSTTSNCTANLAQDLHLQEALNYKTSEQIMTKPTCQICHWITNCHHHINNHKTAAKIRAKLCTNNIQQYFTRKPRPQSSTTDKNLLRPP